MVTYPGLPGPQIIPYLTREASRGHYAAGTEFAMDRLSLLGNTGTYLDAPYHRYRDGADLSGIALARTADLPAVVVRVTARSSPASTSAPWPRSTSPVRRCCCIPATMHGSAHRPTLTDSTS